jgi:hypothetical protein
MKPAEFVPRREGRRGRGDWFNQGTLYAYMETSHETLLYN